MKILDSRLYRLTDTIANYFLLNLLWFLLSLPLVTAFPATVALFSVLRAWRTDESAELIAPFFGAFRRKLGRSLLLGVGATIVGVILVVDFLAVRQIPGAVAIPVLFALGLVTILYLQMTVYLYPMLAHIDATPREIIRNCFLLALSQPFASLLVALGLIALAFATYVFPFTPLLIASGVAQGLNAIFRRAVGKFAPGGLRGEIAALDPPAYPDEAEPAVRRR